MNEAILALAFVVAYLVGAIPTAVWFGITFYKTDVRKFGSGNAGATNTFRVLGKKPGTIVLVIDILKGWLATNLAALLFNAGYIGQERLILFQLLLGMVAVLGHIYPVYTRFKGGKGVATLLGMMLAIHPLAALAALAVFLIFFLSTGFVSLGSVMGALSFPLLLLSPLFAEQSYLLIGFGTVLALLVVYTHRQNIKRLLNGTESKSKRW